MKHRKWIGNCEIVFHLKTNIEFDDFKMKEKEKFLFDRKSNEQKSKF